MSTPLTTRDQLWEFLLKLQQLRDEYNRLMYGEWPRIMGIQ